MRKRLLALLLCFALCVTLLPHTAMAAPDDIVTIGDIIIVRHYPYGLIFYNPEASPYNISLEVARNYTIRMKSDVQSPTEYHFSLTSGYAPNSNDTNITLDGVKAKFLSLGIHSNDANLTLKGENSLSEGIITHGDPGCGPLNIYGPGSLTTCRISGENRHIIIHGGTITADNSNDINSGSAAIGGDDHEVEDFEGSGNAGHVTIKGGHITAIGGEQGAAIGGGYKGAGTVIIENGTVIATGGEGAAGIGGGYEGAGTVTIENGTVIATGGQNAAGIGGGYLGVGIVTIKDGVVTATGGGESDADSSAGAGIGTGGDSSARNGSVAIQGGVITAAGGKSSVSSSGSGETAAAIGSGLSSAATAVTITGGGFTTEVHAPGAYKIDHLIRGASQGATSVKLKGYDILYAGAGQRLNVQCGEALKGLYLLKVGEPFPDEPYGISDDFTPNAADGGYDFTMPASNVRVLSIYPVNVTVSASPPEGGSVSGGGAYAAGGLATVTATPNFGFRFVEWKQGSWQRSTQPSYTFNADNQNLTAVFEPIAPAGKHLIGINASPTEGGTINGGGASVSAFSEGEIITVTAAPKDGYRFVEWRENGQQVSTSATFNISVNANRNLFAIFETLSPGPYSIGVSASPTNGGRVTGGGTYDANAPVIVTANPNGAYRFVEWRENGQQVSTDATYTFHATKPRNLVAVFQAQYIITAGASPSEGGRVSGGGIYPANMSVTVTAAPNNGYQFVKWTENGQEVSTSESYSFTATQARHLTAVFEEEAPVQYTIDVDVVPTQGGSVSGGGTYDENESVTVTASPSSEYQFVKWTENGQQVSIDTRYTFNATANRSLLAVFIRKAPDAPQYTIGVSASPTQGGSVGGGGTYDENMSVSVTATPNRGYKFAKWTENGQQVSTDARYTFYATANRNLTAVFEEDTPTTVQYTIGVSASPAQGGSVSGGGTYDENASVTVTASPSHGYKFVKWTENGQQASADARYTFAATKNRNLTAVFEEETPTTVQYTIGVSASPAQGGSVSGGGTYDENASVTVMASPNRGYKFAKWIENGQQVSTNARYTFAATANRSLTAVFEEDTPGHTHSYGDWFSNGAQHWHECEDDACPDADKGKTDLADHTQSGWITIREATETEAGSRQKQCVICNAVLETEEIPPTGHTHVWETGWSHDENGHWHACAGCGEKKDQAVHRYGNDDVCDDCGYQRASPDPDIESRIENQPLTEAPPGLQNTQFNTVEKIREELTRILTNQAGYASANTVLYDVKLQFSRDGGRTWIDATEANFPEDGITVKFPYPAGTGKDTHNFRVSHMFTVTSARLGTRAGETETPPVTKLNDGVLATLNGLSPVGVAWKEIPQGDTGGDGGDHDGGHDGGDGPSHGEKNAAFWKEVERRIEEAGNGDLISVDANGYDEMPCGVMEALHRSGGVSLEIRWSGGPAFTIPAGKALRPEIDRIFYRLADLAERYGREQPMESPQQPMEPPQQTAEPPQRPMESPQQTAEPPQQTAAPEVDSDTTNPNTGGPTESPDIAASGPAQTDDPQPIQEITPSPVSPSSAQPQAETGNHRGAIAAAVAAAAAALALAVGIAVFRHKKRPDGNNQISTA